MTKSTEARLIKTALKALKNSYSRHSGFKVGSALLSKAGKIYAGTNVEFDAFSLTVCAERSALFGAITHGARKFPAIAVATSSEEFVYPCGLCRQALVEFNPNMEVILVNNKNKVKKIILKDIIPNYFKL